MAALWIKALRDGFRRAGVAHPAAWVAHPDGAFDAGQEAALRAEAMLLVQDAAPEGFAPEPEPAPAPEPERAPEPAPEPERAPEPAPEPAAAEKTAPKKR